MIQGFEFENAGRTFTCSVEATRSSPLVSWWWFKVSPRDPHRYAPFHADPKDTRGTVAERVVAYYDDLVARREAPAQPHWRRVKHTQDAEAAAARMAAEAAAGAGAPAAPDTVVEAPLAVPSRA